MAEEAFLLESGERGRVHQALTLQKWNHPYLLNSFINDYDIDATLLVFSWGPISFYSLL